MDSAAARPYGVDLSKVQRDRTLIRVITFDGKIIHGQLVSFDDWHMLMQLNDGPCVVILEAVSSIEEA